MYGLAATKTAIYDLTGAVSKSVQISEVHSFHIQSSDQPL